MATTLRIVHLGACGSFSEEAARVHAERSACAAELCGEPTPADVLARLARGACDLAVLPVANSCGGLVWPTLSALSERDLVLADEVVLPVRVSLFAARPGIEPAAIRRMASHPQAFRQCARTLARLLPGRTMLPWSDTASAARDLAAGVLDEHTGVLCSLRAGERYGLALHAADVHDEPDNRTFFAVLRPAPGTVQHRGDTMAPEIEDIEVMRTRIEQIDTAILRLLGERFSHVRLLGRFKARADVPVESPEREARLRTMYLQTAQREGLDPTLVLRVFEAVIERSRQEQRAQVRRPKTA
jgi:prephenate dehydratase